MTDRFDAEEVLRAAASGQFPATNQVLVRKQLDADPKGHEGWVFGFLDFEDIEGEIDPSQITTLPFVKITGIAARSQLPVAIAYEDEVNVFEAPNTFQADNTFEAQNTFEGQLRKRLITITAALSPYTVDSAAPDWHINVDVSLGSVDVLVPDAALHNDAGFTDQLHFKLIGTSPLDTKVTLIPFGSQLIDDAEFAIIRSRNRSFTLVSDSLNWWIQ